MKVIKLFPSFLLMLSISTGCFGQLEMRKDKKGRIEFFAHNKEFKTKRANAMQCAVDALGSAGYDVEAKHISSVLMGTAIQAFDFEGDKALGRITFRFAFGFQPSVVIFAFNDFSYTSEASKGKNIGPLPYAYKGKVKKVLTETEYEELKTRISKQVSDILDTINANCTKED